VGAGYGNAVSIIEQGCQQLGAVPEGQTALSGFGQFRVDRGHGGGVNNQLGRAEVGGSMTNGNGGARGSQVFGQRGSLQVRTTDLIALLEQHLGKGTHPVASDTNKVNIFYVCRQSQRLAPFLDVHQCLKSAAS